MRKFKVKPQSSPVSDINITPLVDVVLVLLIIFMVVTPLLEKDIEVRVPDQEHKDEPPPEVPPDQLVVSISKEGDIAINAEKVLPAEYVDRLKKMVNAKPRGERLVFFTADDETNYAKLVTALDGARLAGAETLGMATEKMAPGLANPATTPAPTP
jgi:biopolymer transport protein TolR